MFTFRYIWRRGNEWVFASLASSHPDIDDRIARLQSLGVYVKEDSLINKF